MGGGGIVTWGVGSLELRAWDLWGRFSFFLRVLGVFRGCPLEGPVLGIPKMNRCVAPARGCFDLT